MSAVSYLAFLPMLAYWVWSVLRHRSISNAVMSILLTVHLGTAVGRYFLEENLAWTAFYSALFGATAMHAFYQWLLRRKPKPGQPETPSGETIAAGLMEMNEKLRPATEAAIGFRNQLEEAGYSPTMAEQLAGELHRGMLRQIFKMND